MDILAREDDPNVGAAVWEPAGAMLSLKAGLVDFALGAVLPWFTLAIVLFAALTAVGETMGEVPGDATLAAALPAVFTVTPLVSAFVYLAFGWSRGATVGMASAGILLKRSGDGGVPGVARGIARAGLTLLLVPWIFVSAIVMAAVIVLAVKDPLALIFVVVPVALLALPAASYARAWRNEDRQTMHDHLLGLRVIRQGRSANLALRDSVMTRE